MYLPLVSFWGPPLEETSFMTLSRTDYLSLFKSLMLGIGLLQGQGNEPIPSRKGAGTG